MGGFQLGLARVLLHRARTKGSIGWESPKPFSLIG